MDFTSLAPLWAATNSVLIVSLAIVAAVFAAYWIQSLLTRIHKLENMIAYLHGRIEKVEKNSTKEFLYAAQPTGDSEKLLPREPEAQPAPQKPPPTITDIARGDKGR